MSASPAFRAVICVHNKLVQDKESKLRVGLTFPSVFSIIQQGPEEGWPLVILSRIKQGLHTKPRLICVDLKGPALIHSSHLWTQRPHVLCQTTGLRRFLYFIAVQICQLCSWLHVILPPSCIESPVYQTALWSPIHPFFNFEWGFEWQVLCVNSCCSFSALSCLLILSALSLSSAPVRHFCLYMVVNCVWWRR